MNITSRVFGALVAGFVWTATAAGIDASQVGRLQVGMSAAQVRGVLGDPGGVLPFEGSTLWWYAVPQGRAAPVPLYLLFVGQPARLWMWEAATAPAATPQAATRPVDSDREACLRRYRYFEDRIAYCY